MKIEVKISYPSDEVCNIDFFVDGNLFYNELARSRDGVDIGVPINDHFVGIWIDPPRGSSQ
jgi:hypothetical protein